jgi:hypothetical protein
MSEQRCWDCTHGKRMGVGAKNGTPDVNRFASRVRCDVAFYFGTYHFSRPDDGENCPAFKPREGGNHA